MHKKGLVIVMALAAGCAHRGGATNVQRVDAGTQTDLSGKWNDTDAKLTSEELIKQCFAAGWLPGFQQESGRKPAVRVRGIVNKTDEHIDAQVFIKNVERAMVNSGKVKVLAQEGAELASVEAEQQRGASGAVSDETAPSLGNETGADFVVAVRLASILDQVQGKKAKLYKVSFELISPSTGEKVWIGDHEIKKIIEQDRVSW
jgi:penicillin-binding protein activator